MRRRRIAAGMFDHRTIGLLSTLFGVVVGLCAGGLSLLLRWPGLVHSSLALREAGLAHVPLLIFFSAIPASLGGLAVSSAPSLIGSRRGSVPWIFAAGFGLLVCALIALVGGGVWSWPLLVGIGINLLASGTMLTATNLIATILNQRRFAYAALPNTVWTTLIASALTVCAAPIAAAACTMALWRGEGLGRAAATAGWPAICVVLVLMIGLVGDIFAGISLHKPLRPRWILWMLTIEVFVFFVVWASGLLHRSTLAFDGGMFHALLGVLLVPFELVWLGLLLRAANLSALRSLPVLFAIGFAIVLPIGLLLEAAGVGGHETVSLSIIFGLFAGFHRLTLSWSTGSVATVLARLQFWFLLGGTVMLLLPLPEPVRALWAAMLSLSVGLFVVYLVVVIARPRDASAWWPVDGAGILPIPGKAHS